MFILRGTRKTITLVGLASGCLWTWDQPQPGDRILPLDFNVGKSATAERTHPKGIPKGRQPGVQGGKKLG